MPGSCSWLSTPGSLTSGRSPGITPGFPDLPRFCFCTLLLLAWLLGLTGCEMGAPESGSQAAAEEKLDEEGKQEKAATRVQVVLPRRGMVRDSITLSDDLRAVDQVDINSRVTGVVTQVPLREGDWVEENGLILSLDTEELTLTCREQEYNHKDAVERAKNASLERTERE